MIRLSIIIPYYNTYDLTIKLLNQLIPQLTDEVEVFLIDDGCNEKRLDKYSNKINIIHSKENKGASASWNIGIKASKGDYIAFIDSDDMITSYYVKTLLNVIKTHNEDVIKFDWMDMNTGKIIKNGHNLGIWKAIYKREITPLFNESWRVHTDLSFQSKLASKKPSVYYLESLLYCYNTNRIGSITWNNKHRRENING